MRKVCIILAAVLLTSIACRKEYREPEQKGNPVISPVTVPQSGYFGDSLSFTVNVSDKEISLSMLKVQLMYGETKVQDMQIRTKENGDYSGKIYVPFYKNIPNGTATLRLILYNITTKQTTLDLALPLQRPVFPKLILVTEDSSEYDMLPDTIQHSYTSEAQDFPLKFKAYIKAPAYGENGNPISFGMEGGEVIENSNSFINFSSKTANYPVSFNTFSYEYAPTADYKINGNDMVQIMSGKYVIADEIYSLDLSLATEQILEFKGFADFNDWWIDEDFFEKTDNGILTFKAAAGKYRILANSRYKYFTCEAMTGNNLATTVADGTGAVWIIGSGIGKPFVETNEVGWTTEKGLCLAPIGDKKYRITAVVGETLKTSVDFKFFYQKDWGGEFGGTAVGTNGAISTTSTIFSINPGPDNNGNVNAVSTLTEGKKYIFTVDLSGGLNAAVLSVEEE